MKEYIDKLTKLGIYCSSDGAPIQIINSNTNNFESFKWKYLKQVDFKYKAEITLFNQIVEVLTELQYCINNKGEITLKLKDLFLELDVDGVRSLAKNAIEYFGRNNYNKLVSNSLKDSNKIYDATWNNYSTKKLFKKCGAYNDIMKINPLPNTIEMDGKKLLENKVTLTTGKVYQVINIMSLVDKQNSREQLTDILGKLSSEDHEIIEKELVLKIVYTYNKNINNIDKCNTVGEIVNNMSQKFKSLYNQYVNLSLAQIKLEETKLTGGSFTGNNSYLYEVQCYSVGDFDPIAESYL